MHHKASIWLAWVHSGRKYNRSSHCNLFWPAKEVGYNDHFAIVTGQCLSQNSFSDFVFGLIGAQSLEQLAVIWVSVGITVCNVHFIIVVFHSQLERQRVVRASSFFLHCILKVSDIVSFSVPTQSSWFACFFIWVHEWFLPLVIRAVRLDQVDYVEFVTLVFLGVGDFEIEPLGVSSSLVIVL